MAVHDDRNGHACTWDLFEAHAQNETRDSIGWIIPKGEPWRGARAIIAAAPAAVRARGVEDGILFRVALCKVESSAVTQRGELQHSD